ncbi:alpha/beta hydrolase [bacterium]|nr:alpha/beta hydrolase [bacterium]
MQHSIRALAFTLLFTFVVTGAVGQEVYSIWENGPPTSNGLSGPEINEGCPRNISEASLTVFHPEAGKSNGVSILVVPGGAYWVVCVDHEGKAVADLLVEKGYTVAVLKYRLPNGILDVPLQDAQQAMRLMRSNALAWGVSESNVGILGFSAGGHLASSVGTHFKTDYSHGLGDNLDVSSRPDFMVLVYPVISVTEEYGHAYSTLQLLGPEPDSALIELYSNDLQVTEETPPTILIHSGDDKTVHSLNSVMFYSALRNANVPAELHIFEAGGHGYGLDPESASGGWTALVETWLSNRVN